jgi:hypothetical protein
LEKNLKESKFYSGRNEEQIAVRQCLLFENVLFVSLLSKYLKVTVYKIILLPVDVYGCETWSLILREESRLRVFENRVLRRIFGL